MTGAIYVPASLPAGAWWPVSANLAFTLAAALTLAAIAALNKLRPSFGQTIGPSPGMRP